MAKMIKRKKKTGKVLLGIITVLLLTAVILLGALAGAVFVVAKGPAKSESQRLCATFAEKKFPLAGLFYSAEELQNAEFYLPPEQLVSDIYHKESYSTSIYYINTASNAWDAVVVTGIDPVSLSLSEGNVVAPGAKYTFGLNDDINAFLIGDYLTYRGDDGELYAFCAMDSDGVLNIGAKTAYEAANSGYVWGICADRVLLQNSSPASELGGGYASRVAIGQASDGSIILVFANDRGIYPSGITYSELASIMLEYGAVNAASLSAEGAFYVDGVGKLGSKSEHGISLFVKGGAN